MSECQTRHRVETSSNSGYLASYLASGVHGVGTPSCPWNMRAVRGRQIKLTLFNFIPPTPPPPGEIAAKVPLDLYHDCYHVGVIQDGLAIWQSVTACSSEPRQRTVFVSSSSSVSFEFAVRGLHMRPPDHDVHLLIHYDGQKFSCLLPLAFHVKNVKVKASHTPYPTRS